MLATFARRLLETAGQWVWLGPPLLALAALVALVYTTPLDNYLVAEGVWDYGEDRVIGKVGYVPLEEYAFFVLQPLLAGLWPYRLLRREPAALSRRPPKETGDRPAQMNSPRVSAGRSTAVSRGRRPKDQRVSRSGDGGEQPQPGTQNAPGTERPPGRGRPPHRRAAAGGAARAEELLFGDGAFLGGTRLLRPGFPAGEASGRRTLGRGSWLVRARRVEYDLKEIRLLDDETLRTPADAAYEETLRTPADAAYEEAHERYKRRRRTAPGISRRKPERYAPSPGQPGPDELPVDGRRSEGEWQASPERAEALRKFGGPLLALIQKCRKGSDLSDEAFAVQVALEQEGLKGAEEIARESSPAFEDNPHWKDSTEQEKRVRLSLYKALEGTEPKKMVEVVEGLMNLLRRA